MPARRYRYHEQCGAESGKSDQRESTRTTQSESLKRLRVSPCKLCGIDGRLVDAHIIPAAFFRDLHTAGGGGPPLEIVANDPKVYPKRAPIGVYDQGLVCDACERRFGPWDTYAAELLIQGRDTAFRPVVIEGRYAPAIVADGVDYHRFRMFVLSLLWRAAASSHPYFSRVTIPRRVERLRELVLSDQPGGNREFSTVLSRWKDSRASAWGEKLIVSPYEYRSTYGPRMVRLFIGSFVLDVRVSDIPLPLPLDQLQFLPGGPLYAIERELVGSKDLNAVVPAIKNLIARKKRPPRAPT